MGEEASVDDPLAQRLLDIIYHDPGCRRVYKELLTDWILDTQSRTAPLEAVALVQANRGTATLLTSNEGNLSPCSRRPKATTDGQR